MPLSLQIMEDHIHGTSCELAADIDAEGVGSSVSPARLEYDMIHLANRIGRGTRCIRRHAFSAAKLANIINSGKAVHSRQAGSLG